MRALIRSRLVWVLAGVLLLGGAYLAAGYWLVPRLVRSQATAWMQDNLKKPLALGVIRFDPIGFKLDISDISVPDARAPMAAVKHLHVDFAIESLFSSEYRFDSVRIERPYINAVVRPDGSLNLIELVPPPSPEPLPAMLIAALDVRGGRVDLQDQSRAGQPRKTLAPISFVLNDFYTTRAKGGSYRFDATSERGETFAWQGRASMAPIASSGGFSVHKLHSETIQKFFGENLPLSLTGGTIDLTGSYTVGYGERGASASLTLPRLSVTGLTAERIATTARAVFTFGAFDVYRLGLKAEIPARGAMQAALTVPEVTLADFTATGKGVAAREAVRLGGLAIGDVRVDMAQRSVTVGALSLDRLTTSIRRERDGSISLMKLVPPELTQASAPPSKPAPVPWSFRLGSFTLADAGVRIEDRTVAPAAVFDIRPIRVEASALSMDMRQPVPVTASARINAATQLTAKGTVTPATMAASIDFALNDFPLRAALPYMPRFPALDMRGGTFGVRGALLVPPQGARSSAPRFRGSASVDGFRLFERVGDSELFSWSSLQLAGIDYSGERVAIDRVRLVRPFGRIVILPDSSFNFTALLTPGATPEQIRAQAAAVAAAEAAAADDKTRPQKAEPPPAPPTVAPVVARPAEAAAPAMAVSVKRLDIEQGVMSFADFSIEPNFEARIDNLRGRIGNISTAPGSVATIGLLGQVINRFSPVEIKGTANLLAYDAATDVTMAFRNIELPIFNPYSGAFAGYAIAKGKLTTELHYRIDNRALNADHHVVIDQLEWGEATATQARAKLPIRLATSLLKDKDGVIDLDVPVTGSLDDPKFRIGPIIWQIVGNLLEKIVTAPFRFIGSLFGGAEDAQFVDFGPGSAMLPETAAKAMPELAKGLADRPALKLDIAAGPGIEIDAVALADQRIDAAALGRKATPEGMAALDLDGQHDRLASLYKARFGAAPAFPPDLKPPPADQIAAAPRKRNVVQKLLGTGKAAPPAPAQAEPTATAVAADPAPADEAAPTAMPTPPPALTGKEGRMAAEILWMREQLRTKFAPTDAELAALGAARAEAVRDALLSGGAIDPARVFIAGNDSVVARDGKARMELKLK